MNSLARQILKILEDTPLKTMSVHLLNKQCEEAGLDLDEMKVEDLPTLISRLEKILPFFIGSNTKMVLKHLKELNTGGMLYE